MFPNCACGETTAVLVKRVAAPGGPIDLVRCQGCRLVRSRPECGRPADLLHLYSDKAGIYPPPKDEREFDLMRRGASGVAERIVMGLDHPAVRALDIGCRSGALMVNLIDRGFDCSGIEYTPAAAEYAGLKGLDVWQGDVMEFPFRESSLELIVLNHVLEHLADPCELLQRLKRALVPDGTLFLGVPNYLSIVARHPTLARRLLRQRARLFRADEHLWYFSPATIRELLERMGYRIYYLGTYTDLGHRRTVRSRLMWPLGRLIERSNRGESIEVFAHRQERNN